MINISWIKWLAPFLVLLGPPAFGFDAGPIKVAIIDTGISDIGTTHLCATGHKDFTGSGSIVDRHRFKHGSNIAAIIEEEAGPGNWCMVILKAYGGPAGMEAYLKALKYVEAQKFPITNISMSGLEPDATETAVLKRMLDAGQVIVVAAGNDSLDLNLNCNSYPACVDKRLLVVSDMGLKTANKGGPVDLYVSGRHVKGAGVTLSGTSQSTAKVSGLIVREAIKKRGY
jgi:hypothetical protein